MGIPTNHSMPCIYNEVIHLSKQKSWLVYVVNDVITSDRDTMILIKLESFVPNPRIALYSLSEKYFGRFLALITEIKIKIHVPWIQLSFMYIKSIK